MSAGKMNMMSRLTATPLYFLFAAFIAGWWLFAFRQTEPTFIPSTIAQPLTLKTSQLLEELSPLQRESLHTALSGNFSLMVDLIEQWDLDAQILARQGIPNQRLSSDHYLQAHILGHLILNSSPDFLRKLNCKMNLDTISDDIGKSFKIEDTFARYLPQTYVAASFLLSIARPEEILSIPKGMRYLSQLYRPELLALVPERFDRIVSEQLYLANPQIAFVAPYSHPPSLEVLKNQNIQLYTLKNIDKLEEIPEALLKIGHASNHILEAQLLAIFMEASFFAIDNRLQALYKENRVPSDSNKMLYLCYRQNFTTPTSKCLTGQLMARAMAHSPQFTCPIPKSFDTWLLPIEQEQILNEDPDFLLIAAPIHAKGPAITQNILAIRQSKAFKSKKICYLDEAIQDSPTQFIVLAYYDIYQALSSFHI